MTTHIKITNLFPRALAIAAMVACTFVPLAHAETKQASAAEPLTGCASRAILPRFIEFGKTVDMADIKYVLMTHGHRDHVGGAYKLKPLMPNAKFVMTQAGWDEAFEASAKSQGGRRSWKFLNQVDVVAKDSQGFTLGDATFTAYETPGHTFGTASYGFDVKDGETIHRAFTIGGLGLNAIKSTEQVEAYIASVKRIQALANADDAPITVDLTTHGFSTGLNEAAQKLPARKPSEPHPLVDP